jgi:hypothetical protein
MKNDSSKNSGIRVLDELRSEFVRVTAEERRSAMHRFRPPYSAAALAGLLIVFIAAASATFVGLRSGKDDPRGEPYEATRGGFAASGPRYTTLRELVSVSDLIITGSVQEVSAPEPEGEPPEEIYHVNAVVDVDEVWKGSAPGEMVTVKTLELAYEKEWRRQGEQVLLFLSPSRETPGLFIPANVDYYQTAYMVAGKDLIATLPNDALARQIAAMSRSELRERVREE